MIRSYSEFIASLIQSITSGSGDFTWSDFGGLMKNSVTLVAFLLFMTVGLYAIAYWAPVFAYKHTVGRYIQKNEALFEEGNYAAIQQNKTKITKARVVFGGFIAIVYVPLVLPILLMVINVLF